MSITCALKKGWQLAGRMEVFRRISGNFQQIPYLFLSWCGFLRNNTKRIAKNGIRLKPFISTVPQPPETVSKELLFAIVVLLRAGGCSTAFQILYYCLFRGLDVRNTPKFLTRGSGCGRKSTINIEEAARNTCPLRTSVLEVLQSSFEAREWVNSLTN